jgi:xanthine dehydrogenase accessory factor
VKVLAAAVSAVAAGRSVALVTVVGVNGSAPRESGARMLVESDGSIVGTVGGGAWEHRLVEEALGALREGRNRRVQLNLNLDLGMCCGGAMEALIEPLIPNPQLVIYGAGHVGTALGLPGERLGFDLIMVDERDDWLDAQRFPENTRCLLVDPRRALADLPVDRNSYHLIVTHSHQLDQDLVERLLPLDLAWLGMIGSRAKVARFLLRLEAAGLDPLLFPRLSSPVGLDVGAETPEEIAVSIAAELIAVRRRVTRPPLPLSQQPLRARGGDGRAHPAGPASPDDDP